MVKILSWADVNLPSASPILDACSITKAGLIYTSGSVGIRADGTIPESVEEQTEIAIANLKTVLAAAGGSIDTVVKALVFVTDPALIPKVNDVYKTHFISRPPRSCVVTRLGSDKLFVEIELVAEVL